MSCCGIHLSLAYSLVELTGMYVAECPWSRAVSPQVSEPFVASVAVVTDYFCYRAKQVHCVKQALGDSNSLLLRHLNPASQPYFAWLCSFIVETNNEGPTWDICLLTLSFTSICTFRTTLSCFCGRHIAEFVFVALQVRRKCRDCSKAEGRMKLIWSWGFTWTRSMKNLCFLKLLNLFGFKHVSKFSFRSFKSLYRYVITVGSEIKHR